MTTTTDDFTVDEALERVLARFAPLPAVATPILDALGMVVAADVVADVDVPPFRNSAMDGYAVRSADTIGHGARLRVTATLPAGRPPDRPVGPGEAIRIMTGAPLPDGADAVARFEDTDEAAQRERGIALERIAVSRPIRPGENVREAGEDVRRGDPVVRAGTLLRPAEVGVLASLNVATVAVHRRPRVAVLATGDELVELGPPLGPGQIRDSNSYTIAALVRDCGGEATRLGIARDNAEDLHRRLSGDCRPDLFVTSGGVSHGDYDLVKDVLRAEGAIDIWQVRMKPGKPLAFGRLGETPLLGLPGNPVAALVSFLQFGRPAVLLMLGRRDVCLPEVEATLAERLANPGRRRHYVRGAVWRTGAGYETRATGDQGSAILTAAVRANCLIVLHESCDVAEAGSRVRVQLLGGGEKDLPVESIGEERQ
jgi:molybdopterin molybdotransferase